MVRAPNRHSSSKRSSGCTMANASSFLLVYEILMCKLSRTMRRRKHPKMVVPQGARRVGGLTSRIYVHAALRQMRCLLCGDVHEQQYLATGLFDGERLLGDLCPRCLNAGPAGAAKRLRRYLALAASEARTPSSPEP